MTVPTIVVTVPPAAGATTSPTQWRTDLCTALEEFDAKYAPAGGWAPSQSSADDVRVIVAEWETMYDLAPAGAEQIVAEGESFLAMIRSSLDLYGWSETLAKRAVDGGTAGGNARAVCGLQ